MKTCLIGYTGFVGSTLLKSLSFDVCINRANLGALQDAEFDIVYCAGLPAEKWKANLAPEDDARNVATLMQALATVKARKFVLISTVDVYGQPIGCDEDDTVAMGTHAYGKHRLEFEHFIQQRFARPLILRLPALFGHGLKKNILFDLLNNNQVERINPDSKFQWYPIAQLAADIDLLLRQDVAGTLNLCPEPLPTAELVRVCFPDVTLAPMDAAGAVYDVHTKFAHLFGRSGPYTQGKDAILGLIHTYVKECRE
jgi:nucleoside-diphosphate-sugar epimerase